MQFEEIKKNEKLRMIILFIIFFIIGYFVFYYNQKFKNDPEIISEIEISEDEKKAALTINNFNQITSKDGKKQTSLIVKKALLFQDRMEMTLDNISLICFQDDGSEIRLLANMGIYYINSNNIDIKDNIDINYNNYKINTESLKYIDKKRLLFSETPVIINQDNSIINAEKMKIDMITSIIELKGNVRGKFSENFNFKN